MFLQNLVFSCTKRMKKFRERSSAGPHTEAESDEEGGRVNCPASEADQQLVRESLELGLPVIPFGQPSLFLPEREESQESQSRLKRIRRKSSDLKRELADFRFLNKQIYFEDEEEENSTRDTTRTRSSSFNMVENFKRRLSTSSSSHYLDMRPGTVEEPYMRMDEFLGASPSLGDGINKLTQTWKESKGRSESLSLPRFLKKANRHKRDYVLVDLEKDNYVDMNRCISHNKWKSLSPFHNDRNIDT